MRIFQDCKHLVGDDKSGDHCYFHTVIKFYPRTCKKTDEKLVRSRVKNLKGQKGLVNKRTYFKRFKSTVRTSTSTTQSPPR